MRPGLTAGGGMLVGMIVGLIFFGHPALGMIFGMLFGATVAARRRSCVSSRGDDRLFNNEIHRRRIFR